MRLIIICLSLVTSTAISASPANPLFEHYSYQLTDVKKRWFGYQYETESEAQDGDITVGWQRLFGGYIRAPKQISRNDLWSWGTHYYADFVDFGKAGDIDTRLHSLNVPFIWMHKTPDLLYWFTLTPSMNNDLKHFGSDAFSVLGSGFASYEINKQARLLAGVQYDRAFGAPQAYPFGGLLLQPAHNLEVRLTVPDPRVVYAPYQDWAFYLSTTPMGGQWRIKNEGDFIRRRSIVHRFGIARYWKEDAWLEFEISYRTNTNIERYVDNEWQIDEDLDDAWNLTLKFIYR